MKTKPRILCATCGAPFDDERAIRAHQNRFAKTEDRHDGEPWILERAHVSNDPRLAPKLRWKHAFRRARQLSREKRKTEKQGGVYSFRIVLDANLSMVSEALRSMRPSAFYADNVCDLLLIKQERGDRFQLGRAEYWRRWRKMNTRLKLQICGPVNPLPE